MNVNQYVMYNIELLKEVTIKEQVIPAVKFELSLPYGIPFDIAEQVCDDFKKVLQDMKAQQELAKAQQSSTTEVVPGDPAVTPEVVA